MSAANWGFRGGGGGLNIFFRGRNVHQEHEQNNIVAKLITKNSLYKKNI